MLPSELLVVELEMGGTTGGMKKNCDKVVLIYLGRQHSTKVHVETYRLMQ